MDDLPDDRLSNSSHLHLQTFNSKPCKFGLKCLFATTSCKFLHQSQPISISTSLPLSSIRPSHTFVKDLLDSDDTEIRFYVSETYKFQKFFVCLKLILFLELTIESSCPLIIKLTQLSTHIRHVLSGYLFLYSTAKICSQVNYADTLLLKLKYITQMFQQFIFDLEIIFTSLMPKSQWTSLYSVLELYFHSSQNCISTLHTTTSTTPPTFSSAQFSFSSPITISNNPFGTLSKPKKGIDASNSTTQFPHQQQLHFNDSWFIEQISNIFYENDSTDSLASNKKSQINAKEKPQIQKLQRLTIAELASLLAFESDLLAVKEEIPLLPIPTYSSTVFIQIDTFIQVITSYFDAINTLFTSPVAAFELLNTIFQQNSSYKISITLEENANMFSSLQNYHNLPVTTHHETTSTTFFSNQFNTRDTNTNTGTYPDDNGSDIDIDNDNGNEILAVNLMCDVDPNLPYQPRPFEFGPNTNSKATHDSLMQLLQDKAIQISKTNTSKHGENSKNSKNNNKTNNTSEINTSRHSDDNDILQKTLSSDCRVKIKALPVLLHFGLFLTTSKTRLILSAMTGGGKSVLLPLIHMLLSYYDTTSLYYAYMASSKQVSFPPSYVLAHPSVYTTASSDITSYQPKEHFFERCLKKYGYINVSQIRKLKDAKFVLALIIKHTIYSSPSLEQLRKSFHDENEINLPIISNLSHAIPQTALSIFSTFNNVTNKLPNNSIDTPHINPVKYVISDHLQSSINNLPTSSFALPLDIPYIFLLLPSRAIVAEKLAYFTTRYADILSISSLTTTDSFATFSRAFDAMSDNNLTYYRPKLFLSTPHFFLRLISHFLNLGQLLTTGGVEHLPIQYLFHRHHINHLRQKMDRLIMKRILKNTFLNNCRIILDEAHERSVFLDVVLMAVSKLQHLGPNFTQSSPPLHQNLFTIMSATPDSDVYTALSAHHTATITLTTRLLYEVKVKQIKHDNPWSINGDIVPLETIQMMNTVMSNRFATSNTNFESIPPGDCLVFMSGQRECEDAMNVICSQLQTPQPEPFNLNYIILHSKIDNEINLDQFYDHLLIEINTHLTEITPTFILPLILTGKVSQLQKELVCGKLPVRGKYFSFSNVFKLIVATNSIESSVTIDGLTMLVDSGLHKENVFNVEKGVSTLTQKSITDESRIQRKGRVGRTQPAFIVQIIYEAAKNDDLHDRTASSMLSTLPSTSIEKTNELHHTSPPHALPELFTTDPAANVILLRRMGILLEQINKYLPSPLPETSLDKVLTDLKILELITDDGLTPDGILVAKLTASFQPLYAATIIRQYKISPSCGYFTSLVIIAMTMFSDGIVYNEMNDLFINVCMDQHSNLVTLVSVLLAALSNPHETCKHLSQLGIVEKSFSNAQVGFSTVYTTFAQIQNRIQKLSTPFGNNTPSFDTSFDSSNIIKSTCESISTPRFLPQKLTQLVQKAFPSGSHNHFCKSTASIASLLTDILAHLPNRASIHTRVDQVLQFIDSPVKNTWLQARHFQYIGFDLKLGFSLYKPVHNNLDLPQEIRLYPLHGCNPALISFPQSAFFLNKNVNASFTTPFMICSTFHTSDVLISVDTDTRTDHTTQPCLSLFPQQEQYLYISSYYHDIVRATIALNTQHKEEQIEASHDSLEIDTTSPQTQNSTLKINPLLFQLKHSSLFIPIIFSLKLHESFFTSPFSEILLDVFLGKRTIFNYTNNKHTYGKCYEINFSPLFSLPNQTHTFSSSSSSSLSSNVDMRGKNINQYSRFLDNHNNSCIILTIFSDPSKPRTYVEIATILNRVRTLSPHFTQDVILQRDNNFFIQYHNSFDSDVQNDMTDAPEALLQPTKKKLFCSSNQLYLDAFTTQSIISRSPSIYPVIVETLYHYENAIANNQHQLFYPVIIIPTYNFFNFFTHHKRTTIPLTVSNIKVNYRVHSLYEQYVLPMDSTNKTMSHISTDILIAFISSSEFIPTLTTRPLLWSPQDKPVKTNIPNTLHANKVNFHSASQLLFKFGHSRIPSLISIDDCDLHYWAYPFSLDLSSIPPNQNKRKPSHRPQLSSIADFYVSEQIRLYTLFQGQSSIIPWPTNEFQPILQPNFKIFDTLPKTPPNLLCHGSFDLYTQSMDISMYPDSLNTIISKYQLEHAPGYYIGPTKMNTSQSFRLIFASKSSSNTKSIVLDPPAIPLCLLNYKTKEYCDDVSIPPSHPQRLHNVFRINVMDPSKRKRHLDQNDARKKVFQEVINDIITHMSPLILRTRFFDYKGDHCVSIDLIHLKSIQWFIHFYIFAFGINLSNQNPTWSNAPLVIPIDIPISFNQLPLPSDSPDLFVNMMGDFIKTSTNTMPTLSMAMADDYIISSKSLLTQSQLQELFQQSTQCQNLYTTALSHFFTPFKSPHMASIWKKRTLVTLTPIFFSLKDIPIYLTPVISEDSRQFRVMLNYSGLATHILPNGTIFSQVSTLAHLLDFYRHTPNASEITHPVLIDPRVQTIDNGQHVFTSLPYKVLAKTIRPILSKLCCLMLDDVSLPIIFSNVFMVVFVHMIISKMFIQKVIPHLYLN